MHCILALFVSVVFAEAKIFSWKIKRQEPKTTKNSVQTSITIDETRSLTQTKSATTQQTSTDNTKSFTEVKTLMHASSSTYVISSTQTSYNGSQQTYISPTQEIYAPFPPTGAQTTILYTSEPTEGSSLNSSPQSSLSIILGILFSLLVITFAIFFHVIRYRHKRRPEGIKEKPTMKRSLGICTIAATFTPTLNDEMNVQIGDRIQVLVEFDDGWCQGINLSQNYKKGVFPRHCLDEIS